MHHKKAAAPAEICDFCRSNGSSLTSNVLYTILYGLSLCNEYREGICSVEVFILGNVSLLIGDHVLDICTVFHNGILHQDTVLHFSAFSYFDATE